MELERKDAFNFTIAVDDILLGPDDVERVGGKLRDLVLKELARIDNRGDLVASPLPTARSIGGGGGGTVGFRVGRG